MKEKLIITLWKAQLKQLLPGASLSCRLTYNSQSRSSKSQPISKSLQWKQTFIFPLSKQQLPLRLDLISLKHDQQIHYANDPIAQSIGIGKGFFNVGRNGTKGSLPARVEVVGEDGKGLGVVLIQYEVLKTEVTYIVEKAKDYQYMLKLTAFKVNFLRDLKQVPKFHLKLTYGAKVHREDFAFTYDKGVFSYNYPIKLYIDKQIQMLIQLQVRQFNGLDYSSANQSIKSEGLTQKRSQMSTIGKGNTLDIDFYKKTSTILDLNMKTSSKTTKKLSLTSLVKNQARQIGSIQFQVQAVFKSAQQKQLHQQQKRGNLLQNPQSSPKKRSSPIPQSNGFIILNTLMGRLQQEIVDKDVSITLKLGKQILESQVLQKPKRELIFFDIFTFRRTWEETIKFVVNVHNQNGTKTPTLYASLNLRDLFEAGYIAGKKIKVYDQNKHHCGLITLQMTYKDDDKKPKQADKSILMDSILSIQDHDERKKSQKRQIIMQRMKKRQSQKLGLDQNKAKQRQTISISQALDLKDLILPPLNPRKPSLLSSNSRYTTLSPQNSHIFNSNHTIKFTRSPRFQPAKQSKAGDSFVLQRQSDFDGKKKRGSHIGYGEKHDFTKEVRENPGIGKYVIPSLWDKYN